MYETIDKAIELLASKLTNAIREDQAMKYTQSVLNLAHAKATLKAINTPEPSRNDNLRRLTPAGEDPKVPTPKGAGA